MNFIYLRILFVPIAANVFAAYCFWKNRKLRKEDGFLINDVFMALTVALAPIGGIVGRLLFERKVKYAMFGISVATGILLYIFATVILFGYILA